ncbi:MAG: LuxR C-terminal-related transcriptional regulator [Acidimicrobiales bacterium]
MAGAGGGPAEWGAGEVVNGGLGWAEGLGSADLDLLRRLLAGQSTARIARGLGISFDAANDRLQALLSKLGVRSKLEAVTMARRVAFPPSAPVRSWRAPP